MAEDGIKIYYTPDLRKYTSVSKSLIAVPWGPNELFVPPSTDRFFLTRTCVVDTQCKDVSDSTLKEIAQFLSFGGANDDQNDLRDRFVNRGSVDDDDVKDEEEDDYEGEDAATTTTGASPSVSNNNNNADMMQGMLENISCSAIKPFCFMGEFGSYIQQLCPKSCGFCDANINDDDGTVNPRNPDRYRVTAVNYHAHLLGNEMYATLLRPSSSSLSEGDDEDENPYYQDTAAALTQKKLDLRGSNTLVNDDDDNNNDNNTIAKDLKSREMRYYDDQASIAMDTEFVVDVNNDDGENNELMQGVAIQPGDKIQTTCVYNSNDREEKTKFGLSTYDEMCIIGLQVTFETPSVTDDAAAAAAAGIRAELALRSFACRVDDENHTTDVWQGTLEPNEDPRNIWKDHPIEATDRCIFTVKDYAFVELMTGESRNCPDDMEVAEYSDAVCYGFGEEIGTVEFLYNRIAGYTCDGGAYDQKDSNEGDDAVTEKKCIEEGGGNSYDAYTCSDAQMWLDTQASSAIGVTEEVKEYIRTYWLQPKCCREIADDDDEDNDDATTGSDSDDANEVSEGNNDDTKEDDEKAEEVQSSSGFLALSHVLSCIVSTVVVVVTCTFYKYVPKKRQKLKRFSFRINSCIKNPFIQLT